MRLMKRIKIITLNKCQLMTPPPQVHKKSIRVYIFLSASYILYFLHCEKHIVIVIHKFLTGVVSKKQIYENDSYNYKMN